MEDAVDLLDRVDVDRDALLLRELAHVFDRLTMTANLVANWLQPRIRHDAHVRIDGRLQFLKRVHDAFERAVVVHPRHLEALAVLALKLLVQAVQTLVDQRPALFDRKRGRSRRGRRNDGSLRRERRRTRWILGDLREPYTDELLALFHLVSP